MHPDEMQEVDGKNVSYIIKGIILSPENVVYDGLHIYVLEMDKVGGPEFRLGQYLIPPIKNHLSKL
jgi:hypothetical protein